LAFNNNNNNNNRIEGINKEVNYTPYHNLVNYSAGTSQYQSINTIKKELFASNNHSTPVQLLNLPTSFPIPKPEVSLKETKQK